MRGKTEARIDRSTVIAAPYSTLNRLEWKCYVTHWLGDLCEDSERASQRGDGLWSVRLRHGERR